MKRSGAVLKASLRPVIESLERRLLLHGIGPDGKPIDDGGADDGAGSILVADNADGTAQYVSSYPAGTTAAAPLASSSWTTGNKTVLFIRATYSDQPTSDPESAAAVAAEMTAVSQFMMDNSGGQTSLATTVTDLIVLPHPLSYYNTTGGDFALRSDAINAAKAANPAWDTSLFDLDAVRFNGGPGNYSGQAYVGGRGVWLKTSATGVADHEFGHNFGNWHANSWAPNDAQTIIGPGANAEYGDVFDTMGGAGGGAQHFNNYEKSNLGWFPAGVTPTINTSGTYSLYAHDLGGTYKSGIAYGLVLPKDAARNYWLEYRQNPGWSANHWVSRGIGVQWGQWYVDGTQNSNNGSQLLDTTPNSPDGMYDSFLVVGRTYDDNVANIHVTPVAQHAAAAGNPPYMDVVVNFDNAASDLPPALASMTPSATTVTTGTTVNFTSSATDPNGDALAFYWDFGDRAFGADSATASHSWSTAGIYRVRLTVSDMKGQSTSESVLITVGSPAVTNTISGRVLDATGNPVADVRVYNGLSSTVSDYACAYTDLDGRYTMTNVAAGFYTMSGSKAGWSFKPADFLNTLPVGPGDTSGAVSHIDFIATPQRYKVTGTVTLDGTIPVAGALVSDGTSTEVSDSTGRCTFYEPVGTYSLIVTKPGLTFAPSTAIVQFADVTQSLMATGGYVSGSILGLPDGVTVTVSDGLSSTTTLAARGNAPYYTLSQLPLGTWHITATAPGYTLTPSGWSDPLITTGTVSGINFTATATTTYVLRGRVSDLGQSLSGVTVTASGASGTFNSVTDTYGDFAITGLVNGAYTLTPSLGGYTFTPGGTGVTIAGANAAQNFSTTNVNAAPTVATAAAASPIPSSITTTGLSVLGADDGGESKLTYSWSVVSGPAGGGASFTPDTSHAARNATATFTKAGTYTLRATITDIQGLLVSSDVMVTVTAVATFAAISPAGTPISLGASQAFTATVYDQFASPMASQPTWTWSSTGVGSIGAGSGFYTAPPTAGTYQIAVSGGGFSASDSGSVANQPPTVATPAAVTPAPVAGTTANLSVLGADDAGEANLIYTWEQTAGPAAVSFGPNGTNAAKNTSVTFTRAGLYRFLVTISDGFLTTESLKSVTVSQTLSGITAVTPAGANLAEGAAQQYTATAIDQFGQPFVTPPAVTWSVLSGGGSITSAGVYTAPGSPGSFTVKAASGTFFATVDGAVVAASIAGRYVYYNHSYWNDPAFGRTDDMAIDAGKSALLPGQTATFVNYTGYLRGINGVMIDLTNLPAASTLSAADLSFYVGNTSTPGSWAAATALPTVSVRRGMGAGGSDRVELTWADNAIQQQWLQITVMVNGNTGLTAPDVFYFGNQIGETGNSPGDTFVDASDMVAVRDNITPFGTHAPASSRFDLNHDGFADASDMVVVRDHVNDPFNRLQLITPLPPTAPALAAATFAGVGVVGIGSTPTLALPRSTGGGDLRIQVSATIPKPKAPRHPHPKPVSSDPSSVRTLTKGLPASQLHLVPLPQLPQKLPILTVAAWWGVKKQIWD